MFGAAVFSLCASALFGIALVLTQIGLRFNSSRRGAAVSVPTSAAAFWLLASFGDGLGGWDTYAACLFFAAGLLLGVVTLLTFEANRRMGPSVTGALGNLAPLFAILIACALSQEIPGPVEAVGIFAILAGIVLLACDRKWLDIRWSSWLIALPLAAAAIRGMVQPMAKLGLTTWNNPLAASVLGYTSSAAVVLVAAFCERQALPSTPSQITGYRWFVLVGLANGGATLAMYEALSSGSVSLVSPLVASYPVVTLVLATLLIRRSVLTAQLACGVGLTVVGAAVVIAG